MKLKRIHLFSLTLVISLFTFPGLSNGTSAQSSQAGPLYQDMSLNQRQTFVAEKAREIARRMSGTDYAFTRGFETEIQKSVDFYAQRIGNGTGSDARLMFERGQTFAPTLIKIFKTNNVSPLIGLYLPVVESAYVNIPTPNVMGAVGMFQFVPETAQHYGLSAEDLLDVEKSADAAARLITDGMNQFSSDPMKEALSLLAYNRGGNAVERDIAALVNDQNRACSICALTEQRDKLDKNFRSESVYYVPRFLAAAIIGENPQAFGLQTRPLSSMEPKP
jgi:membrane-bound lytic murein transglycosylase D